MAFTRRDIWLDFVVPVAVVVHMTLLLGDGPFMVRLLGVDTTPLMMATGELTGRPMHASVAN